MDSQKNREGQRTARERLREQQAREKAAEKRGRTLKVGGVIVAVLAVAAGVGVVAAEQGGGGSGGGRSDAKPIAVGRAAAPAKLTVYEDFRCPACGQFEQQFRGTVRDLERRGKLRTEYHLVTIIDGNMGGEGSRRAANAAACARDEGRFREYHDVLYQHQPEERDDAFASKKRLVALAGKVKGLDGARFRNCVAEGKHDDWVRRTDQGFVDSGHQATPTVLLDGKDVFSDQNDPLTPQKLKAAVEKRA